MENNSTTIQEATDAAGNRVITVPADYAFAGKYKSIEDLEKGYANSASVHQKTQELEQKLSSYNVPDDYAVPNDLTHLDANDIAEMKVLAKDSGFSQSHFEKYVQKQNARVGDRVSSYEKNVAEIGPDNLKKGEEYIAKHYPEEVREQMKDAFISDSKLRRIILAEREKGLNSKVPGIGDLPPVNGPITDLQLLDARNKMENAKNYIERDAAKQEYMEMINQQHQQKTRGY